MTDCEEPPDIYTPAVTEQRENLRRLPQAGRRSGNVRWNRQSGDCASATSFDGLVS